MKQIKRGVSMNYESALEYIHAVQWAGHKPGLSRTRTLLAALGDPHKKLRFVHVDMTFFIAGLVVIVGIIIAYIVIKKRYWFW